jgi:hypothetical protein
MEDSRWRPEEHDEAPSHRFVVISIRHCRGQHSPPTNTQIQSKTCAEFSKVRQHCTPAARVDIVESTVTDEPVAGRGTSRRDSPQPGSTQTSSDRASAAWTKHTGETSHLPAAFISSP